MSDRPSNLSPANQRKFVPSWNPLESRVLLSQRVFFPDGSSLVFPLFNRLPRTGGTAHQSGTALTIGVGQPTTNRASIAFGPESPTTAVGKAVVEWNGRHSLVFKSVQATLVEIAGARQDLVRIHLPGAPTPSPSATQALKPATASKAIRLGHSVQVLPRIRTGPIGKQSGSVLTITVTTPKINTVAIESWNRGARVEAEWSGPGDLAHGGSPHTFTGVKTIIVVLRNGRKDLVALENMASTVP
jgi:hypothetical protein